MSKTSVIPNRTVTSLSINKELLLKAKDKGINISVLLDGALERELNPKSKEAFMMAIERKLTSIEGWFEKNKDIKDNYYSDLTDKSTRGGEVNVLEKEKGNDQRDFRQALADLENRK